MDTLTQSLDSAASLAKTPEHNPVRVDGRPVRYELLPQRLAAEMRRYIERRQRPSGFLLALVRCEFLAAVLRADPENLANLRALALWLINHAPPAAFGSFETVERWLAGEA